MTSRQNWVDIHNHEVLKERSAHRETRQKSDKNLINPTCCFPNSIAAYVNFTYSKFIVRAERLPTAAYKGITYFFCILIFLRLKKKNNKVIFLHIPTRTFLKVDILTSTTKLVIYNWSNIKIFFKYLKYFQQMIKVLLKNILNI